jgi:CheY-like chemotaxis protein
MNNQIMIVDNEPSIRKTVKNVLIDIGYSTCAVESGRECLDKLRKGFKGLILMDIMMPEMDGWDTIAAIEDEGLRGTNVICILTAANDLRPIMGEQTQCVMCKVNKPFTPEELTESVKICIKQVGKQ